VVHALCPVVVHALCPVVVHASCPVVVHGSVQEWRLYVSLEEFSQFVSGVEGRYVCRCVGGRS